MKLSDIKPNPSNPRIIKDAKFNKLKKSIQEFPAMMELRPMILDSNNVVLGGNMRLKALTELGYNDIPDTWVKRAEQLTDVSIGRINIVQRHVFEKPLLKAIKANNNKVVLFSYKGKLYLNDGNHRVAAAKLRGDKTINAVIEVVE